MHDRLARTYRQIKLNEGRMVVGLSGWMDGGDVSTGTIEYLVKKLGAEKVAEIDAERFCIYSFPGSMELSALFRPHTKIENGLVAVYREPTNTFFCSEPNNLVLFEGREPNFRWNEYTNYLLSMATEFGVTMVYFVGSVAGLVPHTREPRFSCSVSDERLKPLLQPYGVRFSNYEGPASIVTHLTVGSRRKGLGMATLVAELPSYIQGRNVRCIEAVTRKLAAILGLLVDIDDLKAMSDEFEARLTDIVKDRPELVELIRKMEHDYDEEVLDTEMSDLKTWLEQQDIRLD